MESLNSHKNIQNPHRVCTGKKSCKTWNKLKKN